MGAEYQKIVAEITESVCSDMAFLFCDEVEAECDISSFSGMASRMVFHGDLNGDMIVWLETSILTELTVNILGLEDDAVVSEEDMRDALKELLNVLVGQFLVAAAGEEPIFDLSVPLVLDEEKTKASVWWQSPSTVRFYVDERPLMVLFHLEQQQ